MNNFKELAILIVEDNEIALEVLSEMIKASQSYRRHGQNRRRSLVHGK
jgi:CheY-like chemotaxis protein